MSKHRLGDKHPTEDLWRLVAGRDIPRRGVKVGDIGGWVSGTAWVSGDAWVSGTAQVSGD